ncbi:pentatricopeptide repeat-containing protein At4g38150-like [Chenopodium quinoa]|uniref:pentatricopeptide repeat-containing protein At4g38150-like n=1 Tax=Chenopodium quinoa TaxID=63459 RepID=UPI000B7745C3|nr:pentatricopeptide repeat-containing protein At4g38150-like [Chenopodium quinoa]
MRSLRGKASNLAVISKYLNSNGSAFPLLLRLQLFSSTMDGHNINGQFRNYSYNSRRNDDYVDDDDNKKFSGKNRGDFNAPQKSFRSSGGDRPQMPQFNGKTDYPDRNYRRQGRNDGFKNPLNFDEESGVGGVGLSWDQEGRKNYQPSVSELLDRQGPAKGEERVGKERGESEFLDKFKLGDVSKVEEKSDEVEEEAKAKEDSEVPSQEERMAAPKKADEIFKKMKQSGLIPNAVAMLDGLCKDGLVHEAMKLFGMMREKGSMPEVVVYTAVVEGFCQAQNFDDAKRIFRKMQNNGIVPNAFSYTVLIRGLCKGNRLDDAVEFCVEMLENGHSPNVITFTELVLEFCKEKGVEEAQNIILTLKQKGLLLDEKAVRTYLDKNGPTSPLVWEAIFGPKKTAQRPI